MTHARLTFTCQFQSLTGDPQLQLFSDLKLVYPVDIFATLLNMSYVICQPSCVYTYKSLVLVYFHAVSLFPYFFKMSSFFFLFWNLNLVINLLLAKLSLCCYAKAFSSCCEQGLLFVVVRGLLVVVASLVAEHELQTSRLKQLWGVGSGVVVPRLQRTAFLLWCVGFVAPQYVGSSQTRDRTHVPCIGRWILYH